MSWGAVLYRPKSKSTLDTHCTATKRCPSPSRHDRGTRYHITALPLTLRHYALLIPHPTNHAVQTLFAEISPSKSDQSATLRKPPRSAENHTERYRSAITHSAGYRLRAPARTYRESVERLRGQEIPLSAGRPLDHGSNAARDNRPR